MIRQQMVCVICVYGPQTGGTEVEKEAFREEVERLAGLSDGQTMLCIAGDFNAHISVVEPGDEESIGIFGWGIRNREGRELAEMLRRNGLAVAGTFFQNKGSHKITYRSGRHDTELDLLVVRQQLRKVKDCKALAGEYVTTKLLEVCRPYPQHFLHFCDEPPVVILHHRTSLHVPSVLSSTSRGRHEEVEGEEDNGTKEYEVVEVQG